jgi:hypothetical protein
LFTQNAVKAQVSYQRKGIYEVMPQKHLCMLLAVFGDLYWLRIAYTECKPECMEVQGCLHAFERADFALMRCEV